MKKEFVFVTNNPNKLAEIKDIIGDRFRILSLSDINCTDEIPEEQDTLVGNALQKAKYVYDKYKIDCFADDTGLEVDALGGEPGVYSARYAGENSSAEDNIKKLLRSLNIESNRNATFRTVIALILEGQEHFFEGTVDGKISENPNGLSGFGYDPVFIPNGFTDSFAQMPIDLKNKISHRSAALEKFLWFLRNHQ
jgi:XTP/dITP diphosphohydrolase